MTIQYPFGDAGWLPIIDVVSNPGQYSPVKFKEFATEGAADTFIATLSFDFLNTFYQALKKASELLYDAISNMTETVSSELCPIYFTLPMTRLSLKVLDEAGDPYNFVLDDVDIDPTDFVMKLQLFGVWYVAYIEPVDLEIDGSEDLYYLINDDYGTGTYHSGHKLKLSEILIDSALITIILVMLRWLRNMGFQSAATRLSRKTFSVPTVGLNAKLDDISNKIDGANSNVLQNAAAISTVSTRVLSILNDVEDADTGLSAIKSLLESIESQITTLDTSKIEVIKTYCENILERIGLRIKL